MHNKILIADNQLITGSYNFSANAERNAQNQIRITVGSRSSSGTPSTSPRS